MTEIRIELPSKRNREESLRRFAKQLEEFTEDVGMKQSARGWAYQLEGMKLITKAQLDLVENLINECRKRGHLPIDFTAEEEGRKFSGVEVPETRTPLQYIKGWLNGTINSAEYYTPNWWSKEKYYIQMLVEKIDLKNLFEPICKEYHVPIATCFDSQTEILTKEGWKYFTNLTDNDQVATMENGKMVYAKPIRIINELYDGKMFLIENRAINQMITPNHNVYVMRHRNRKETERFELVPISEVVHLQNLKFKKDIRWVGIERKYFKLPKIEINNRSTNVVIFDKIKMDMWLEFFGYFLSEGSTTNKKNYVFRVQLAQKNKDKKNMMIKCVQKIGYNFYQDFQSIQISNKQLYTYLSKLGKSYQKYIPREFLELCPQQLKILLDALIVGDGHKRGKRMVYVTSSKRLADDVQELALKCGYSASIYKRKNNDGGMIRGREIMGIHQIYNVNICMANKNGFRINHRKKDWNIINYSGTVHCVETTSGIIYVRRNGKSVWSGNSKGWASIIQRGEYARRFKEAEDLGLKGVLIYCGDFDCDGLRISDNLRKNLEDIMYVHWEDRTEGYDPCDLIIDRFGLNYNFITKNHLTWIDNLITGSKKNLASPSHKNYHMSYVQDYIKKYGVRKCEANAILIAKEEGRKLCRDAIEKYIGHDSLVRFEERRQEIRNIVNEFFGRTGLDKTLRKGIDIINKDEKDNEDDEA